MPLIEDLDDTLGDALSRLSVWLCRWPESSVTVGAAAALLEVSSEAADDVLDRLWAVDLLDSLDDERYHLAGPARDRAEELAARQRPDERDAALARVINYQLHAAAAARLSPQAPRIAWPFGRLTAAPSPGADTERAALARIDAEIPSLVTAQETALDIEMPELAYPLAAVLAQWLDARRDHTIWEVVCERAIEAAQQCRSHLGEAVAANLLAQAHHDLGHHTRARELSTHALRLSRKAGDQVGAAEALAHLAALHLAEGNPGDAVPALRAAQDLVGEDPECSWLVAVLRRRLGTATGMAGDIENARTHFRYAVEVTAALADDHQQGLALADLGEAELHAGQARAAVMALDDALTVLHTCGRPYSRARAHVLMATAYRDLAALEFARRHVGWAWGIYDDVRTPPQHPAFVEAVKLAADLGVPASPGATQRGTA